MLEFYWTAHTNNPFWYKTDCLKIRGFLFNQWPTRLKMDCHDGAILRWIAMIQHYLIPPEFTPLPFNHVGVSSCMPPPPACNPGSHAPEHREARSHAALQGCMGPISPCSIVSSLFPLFHTQDFQSICFILPLPIPLIHLCFLCPQIIAPPLNNSLCSSYPLVSAWMAKPPTLSSAKRTSRSDTMKWGLA